MTAEAVTDGIYDVHNRAPEETLSDPDTARDQKSLSLGLHVRLIYHGLAVRGSRAGAWPRLCSPIRTMPRHSARAW
jgi:hypothetical protein